MDVVQGMQRVAVSRLGSPVTLWLQKWGLCRALMMLKLLVIPECWVCCSFKLVVLAAALVFWKEGHDGGAVQCQAYVMQPCTNSLQAW